MGQLLAAHPNNNKVSQMLYNKNLYQHRPPLQLIQQPSYNLPAECHQPINKNYTKNYQEPVSSDKRIDGYDRSSSKSYRKNIYEIENRDINRRAKVYCPLSKTKGVIEAQVMRKSREYVQSSEYKDYMQSVTCSSKNREDLIENMKKVRSNNIYLPISQQEVQKSTHMPKSLTRRPIFSKPNFADNNQDNSQDFDFTIDHLSKIEENQILSQQNKKIEGHFNTPNSDCKKQNPAILIQDQFKDQLIQEQPYLRKRKTKTPEYALSPTFPTPVKKHFNQKREEKERISQTKNRYFDALTPPKKKVERVESTNRFVDYREIKYLEKAKMCVNRKSKEKYSYLSSQKSLSKQESSINRIPSRKKFQKAAQSLSTGIKFESTMQTLQSSIYNVDFKLQRPMNHVQSQRSFKKSMYNKCESQNRVNKPTENGREVGLNIENQTSTYSRSRSKGKLSIVTTSKSTHFY